MSGLQIFNFGQQEVRVLVIEGEPWWIAQDVATVLGYSDTRRMLDHAEEEDKKNINPQETETAKIAESFPDNVFKVSIINESGLYSCIFGSHKPEAKAFKKWTTSEVLPSIRKTGNYALSTNQPTQLEQMLEMMKALQVDVAKQNYLLAERERLDKASKKHKGFRDVIDYEVNVQEEDELLEENAVSPIPLDAHTVKTYCIARSLQLNRGVLIRIGQIASSAYKYDKGKEPPKFNGAAFYRGTEIKYIADAVKYVLGLG